MFYVTSTAIIPVGFSGSLVIRVCPPEEIRRIVDTQTTLFKDNIKSYVGHESTAQYLNVPVSRGELPGKYLRKGDVLLGVRPRRRLTPGEEVVFSEENFEGFYMKILEVYDGDEERF